MIYAIALLTFISTLCGGLFALRFRDKLHLILGFSAGAVIGVAFFDLLPEAIELGASRYDTGTITSLVALGFIIFLILDRFALMHCHDDDHHHAHSTTSVLPLILHSLLDGVAIGLAFQVSIEVGAIVAIAVLVHDFSDGINTVGLILRNKGERKTAFRYLLLDAAAPVLGALVASFFILPSHILGIILSLFCGFFLYIGASDLLPESHHSHPTFWTTFMTILGITILYGAIQLAGI